MIHLSPFVSSLIVSILNTGLVPKGARLKGGRESKYCKYKKARTMMK